MIRDYKAEKKIHRLSWFVWKLSAVITSILVLLLLGTVVALGIPELLKKSKSITPETLTAVGLIFLVVFLYLASAFVQWKIGKALDKFKSWAWWLTFFMGMLTLISPALSHFQYSMGSQKPPAWFFFLTGALYFIMAMYILCTLCSKRSRALFTNDYRTRLAHNNFDAIQVTPKK